MNTFSRGISAVLNQSCLSCRLKIQCDWKVICLVPVSECWYLSTSSPFLIKTKHQKKKKSILKANEKSFLKLKRGIKENNRKKQNLREVENKKPRNGKRAYIHFGRLWQYNARSQRRD